MFNLNVAIMAEARSGSYYLCSLLKTSNDIVFERQGNVEIFNTRKYIRFKERNESSGKLHYLSRHYKQFNLAKIIFDKQIENINFLDENLMKKNMHYLVLERKDKTAQLLSYMVASKTRQWRNNRKISHDKKITISKNRMKATIDYYVKSKILKQQFLKDLTNYDNLLNLTYEDLFQKKDVNAGIEKFLDIKLYENNNSVNKKIYDKPYSELVSNYQEVIEFINSSSIDQSCNFYVEKKGDMVSL